MVINYVKCKCTLVWCHTNHCGTNSYDCPDFIYTHVYVYIKASHVTLYTLCQRCQTLLCPWVGPRPGPGLWGSLWPRSRLLGASWAGFRLSSGVNGSSDCGASGNGAGVNAAITCPPCCQCVFPSGRQVSGRLSPACLIPSPWPLLKFTGQQKLLHGLELAWMPCPKPLETLYEYLALTSSELCKGRIRAQLPRLGKLWSYLSLVGLTNDTARGHCHIAADTRT